MARTFTWAHTTFPNSKTEYQRVLGEWLSQNKNLPSKNFGNELSLAEVVLANLEHAQTYYRDSEGMQTTGLESIKYALRPLETLYASKLATEFGPVALKAVRHKMIEDGTTRRVINDRIGQIKRMFKWASSEELISSSIYHGLACVEGLRKGRSKAKETAPIKPVPDEHVDAILPFLMPTLKAMVQLQRATGMRTGEMVIMRMVDIDQSGLVWIYTPKKHKTAHHGHAKQIALGPKAQQAIKPYLMQEPAAYLFSPQRAREEWYAEKRVLRKSKVQPSQINRRKAQPARTPGKHYNHHSYYRAIQYAIKKAGKSGINVPHWHPHQLRHSAATRIRKEHGLDAARAILGHRSLAITETYAEIDAALASQVAAKLG